MAVRLQEVHPAFAHFPIALLPLAIGADLLGRLTGNRALREMGRRVMPLAAASAAASALTGLVAQERVQADGRARELLVRHRGLNLAIVGTATALATWRWRRRRPSRTYLALGLTGVGLVGYTAYLGSKMVYQYGVGVDAAGGVRPRGGNRLTGGHAAAAVRTAAGDMMRGLREATHGRARDHAVRGVNGEPDYAARAAIEGPAATRRDG